MVTLREAEVLLRMAKAGALSWDRSKWVDSDHHP